VTRSRALGLSAALAGAVAAGVAGGAAAERRRVRAPRSHPDPGAAEAFGELPATRRRWVSADDGVRLYVEEVGDADAPLTVVFSHGYALQLGVWHYQRLALSGPPVGRLVFYDQRAHGRSGRGPRGHATIDQLGSDLERIVDACAPTGPLVLVGHSMGGMTIMALADRRPDLFTADRRVVGVALLSTSSGRLAEVSLGLPALGGRLLGRALPGVWSGLGRRAAVLDARRTRSRGSDLSYALTRRFSFGSSTVSPALVELMERLLAATPTEVLVDFAPTFLAHDKLDALAHLRNASVLVLTGSADVQTPLPHARAIAEALPDAELVVVPGAGHMVILERPEVVDAQLRSLVARARQRVAAPL